MMNKEMTRARIRLIGNMNNYDLQRVMLNEVEGIEDRELKCLFLQVKQGILEDRFDHLDQAFDRMKEENAGNTYRAAMRSILEEIRTLQEERFQVLVQRADCEVGLEQVFVLGNLVRLYDSREIMDQAEAAMKRVIAMVQRSHENDRQDAWKILIDRISGSLKWMEKLLAYGKEMKGSSLRKLYVALISSTAKEGNAQEALERTLEAAAVLKGEESTDVYFIFLWETLTFLKQLNLKKSEQRKLWILILETADELNHVPAVAKMHVFLANYAMGESNFTEAKKHLESLEGIVDAYGYELLFEEHAEMIKNAMSEMKRNLPKAGKRSPLRLVEITPQEMEQFSMDPTIRN
ncbi:hypothetical protein SANA_30260 [Gottschalkiaceae bacterium SANA]|nr:hypothetical protein SANA_30260 [Gottschalkiaceae bacterium SANA]